MRKSRAPDLNNERIQSVLDAIDNWKGKLTWDLLISQIEVNIGIRYSRFTFSEYPDIANAFSLKKEILRSTSEKVVKNKSTPRDERVRTALEQVERIKAKVIRLEQENNLLKEQFVTWAHNAERKGVTVMMLNAPLHKPYRQQSKNIKP